MNLSDTRFMLAIDLGYTGASFPILTNAGIYLCVDLSAHILLISLLDKE